MALAIGLLGSVAPAAAVLAIVGVGAWSAGRIIDARFDVFAAMAPPLAACVLVGLLWGWDGALGLFLLWRMFVDARWSVRAVRFAQAAHGATVERHGRGAHLWLTPALCAVWVAFTAPHALFGMQLDLPHAPIWALAAIAGITAIAILEWAVRQAALWRLGDLAHEPAIRAAAHHAMFLFAFLLLPDLSSAVLAMIAWRVFSAATVSYPSLTAVP
ncbi:MAG: hypothetical protein GC189_04215 [Alphaproteobacteria bacterium]|nr:hypothetical protein [Alphaproteobacteria bacterium]